MQTEYSKIDLHNKENEVIAHCIVSNEHYGVLNKYKWYKANGYVLSTINNKSVRIHRYIFTHVLNQSISGKKVDHINNNKLDNRICNLRLVTTSENNRNRMKSQNTTSTYIGVSKTERNIGKKWRASIRIQNNDMTAYYSEEIYAAHQYNLWCKEYDVRCAKLNDIEIPDNFEVYKKRDKDVPKGICFRKTLGKFQVRLRHENISYNLGHFESLQVAINIRDSKLAELENTKSIEKGNEELKKRNQDGQCIVEHFNRKGKKIAESIVDENKYNELIQYKWSLSNNYPRTKINGKMVTLSRYIMKYEGDDYIDHINNNPLDNRVQNLRVVSPQQNALNKSSARNSSSKYTGVSWYKKYNKWKASIRVNGKNTHLGYFENEVDAFNARQVQYHILMT